jgi:hypothetical protein
MVPFQFNHVQGEKPQSLRLREGFQISILKYLTSIKNCNNSVILTSDKQHR